MESALPFLPFLAWVVAAASLALTSLLGIILAFHWFRYAFDPAATTLALTLYLVVSSIFLSGMFASLIAFSISL